MVTVVHAVAVVSCSAAACALNGALGWRKRAGHCHRSSLTAVCWCAGVSAYGLHVGAHGLHVVGCAPAKECGIQPAVKECSDVYGVCSSSTHMYAGSACQHQHCPQCRDAQCILGDSVLNRPCKQHSSACHGDRPLMVVTAAAHVCLMRWNAGGL